MNELELVKAILQKNPSYFVEILLEKNYQLQLQPQELIIIEYLWFARYKQNMMLSFQQLADLTHLSVDDVRKTISQLIHNECLELTSFTSADGKMMEDYDFTPLIHKCFAAPVVTDKKTNVLQVFVEKVEQEFTRKLSPIEIQKIQSWVYDEKIDVATLEYALEEAVLAGVKTFNYMGGILRNRNVQNDGYQQRDRMKMRQVLEQTKNKEFSDEEKAIAFGLDWERDLNENG